MRFRLRYFVGLDAITFLTACALRTPANLPMIPGVRVDAAVQRYQVGPDRSFVRAKAKLVNRGADTARFTVSGCPLTVHASSPDNRDRPPIWSSARLQSPCPDVRGVFRLAPGDSAVLEDDYPMDAISSSGLELKRYAFSVSIRFLEPATESPEYPAGSITISR